MYIICEIARYQRFETSKTNYFTDLIVYNSLIDIIVFPGKTENLLNHPGRNN